MAISGSVAMAAETPETQLLDAELGGPIDLEAVHKWSVWNGPWRMLAKVLLVTSMAVVYVLYHADGKLLATAAVKEKLELGSWDDSIEECDWEPSDGTILIHVF